MTKNIFDQKITNQTELLAFFENAIQYRSQHKDRSAEIAMHIFRRTRPQGMLTFPIGDDLEVIRYEFAALEAPGRPVDDKMPVDEYDDYLWNRLLEVVRQLK